MSTIQFFRETLTLDNQLTNLLQKAGFKQNLEIRWSSALGIAQSFPCPATTINVIAADG